MFLKSNWRSRKKTLNTDLFTVYSCQTKTSSSSEKYVDILSDTLTTSHILTHSVWPHLAYCCCCMGPCTEVTTFPTSVDTMWKNDGHAQTEGCDVLFKCLISNSNSCFVTLFLKNFSPALAHFFSIVLGKTEKILRRDEVKTFLVDFSVNLNIVEWRHVGLSLNDICSRTVKGLGS